MARVITMTEQRKTQRWLITHVVVPVVVCYLAFVLVQAVLVAGPLLIVGGGAAGALWLTRYDSDLQAGPHPSKVRTADTVLAAAGLLALARAALTGPVAAAVLTAVIVAVVCLVARRTAADGSRLGVLPLAWAIALRKHAPATLLCGALGLAVSAGLAWTGVGIGALLGGLLMLAPARGSFDAARREQGVRADVEGALVGAFKGGPRWTTVREMAGRAPVRSVRVEDGTPVEIVLPLPPSFTAARQDDVEGEVAARLKPWGQFVCRFSAGRDRYVIASRVRPLPSRLSYDGRTAVEGTQVWLGVGLATREHSHAPGTTGIANGEPFDFTWDLRVEPHGICVGTTGSGKSVTVQLVMTQLARSGWRLLLVDPKRVEFSAWVGRPGVVKVTTELEDHVDLLEDVRGEMERRYKLLTDAGVNHIDRLPVGDRPVRILLVVDEATELLSPSQAKTDEAKAINEMKGRAAESIGSLLRLARAVGIHVILCAQRADRTILTGEAQNNLAFKILHGKSEQIERTMIGLGDVLATPGVAGRAVARTLRIPQTELQVAYIDPDDLDKWVPVGGSQPEIVQPAHPVIDVPDEYLPDVPGVNDAVDPSDGSYGDYTPYVPPAQPYVPPQKPASEAGHGGGAGTASKKRNDDDPALLVPVMTSLTLANVGGYADVKADLMETVGTALTDSHSAAAYKIQTGGVLLYGPPGTGKTYIAEALAGTLGVKFLKVSVGDLTSKWVGEGSEKIKAAVDAAVGAAPCILLIDEIDAVAGRRDDETSGEGRKGVNALLVELDRLKAAPGVVLMATTNEIERLDKAVIRDGRFAARIRVDLPDAAARSGILRASLEGRPALRVDTAQVADLTGGYTAAMLSEVVNTAARAALKDKRPISTDDLLTAVSGRGGDDRPNVEQEGLDGLVLTAETSNDLRQVISLLQDPARAAKFGVQVPSGVLLAGPPGTGKTSIAKALAAEAKTSFYAINPGDLTSKWQGESERKVREIFERARANAPSIVFIDEIDSFGASRGSDESAGGGERILTTMLAELDGFSSQAVGGNRVFVVAATNRPELLDAALVRPGRLSRTVTIGLPDEPARLELLTRMTAGMPLAPDVDLALLAEASEGYSPAELRGLCEQAAMQAMNDLGPDDEPLVGADAFVAALTPAA